MSHFPFFIDLHNRKGLIVGGGKVAARKLEKLLPFRPELTVVAPRIRPECFHEGITLIEREFLDSDISDDLFFVIIATGNSEVNHKCMDICRSKGILFSCAAEPTEDMFIFPALVTDGPLTIGITTGGSSPTAAQWARTRIESILPDQFGEILEQLSILRSSLLTEETDRKIREQHFKHLFAEAMTIGRPLTKEEIERAIK